MIASLFFPGIVAFFCKLSTYIYNLEVVLTLNVHVGDEIAHANKMAANNLHCNLAKKMYQQKHLKTDFVLANNTWPIATTASPGVGHCMNWIWHGACLGTSTICQCFFHLCYAHLLSLSPACPIATYYAQIMLTCSVDILCLPLKP